MADPLAIDGEDGGAPDVAAIIDLGCRAAEHLHGAGSFDHKVAWAVGAVREATGADWAAYAELDEGTPRVVHADGIDAAAATAAAERHAAEVVRSAVTGDPCDAEPVAGPDASRAADAGSGAVAGARGTAPRSPRGGRARGRAAERWPSQLAVAVVGSEGDLHGALIAGDARPGRLEAASRPELVRLVAAHLGTAIDTLETLTRLAELEATMREAAHQLQYAVLPPTPTVEGAELGRSYVAADPTSPTGGDLYDWIVLPDGDLHVAVVDVLGKGVAATKDALTITHALRLLALDGCRLEDLVSRADAMVTGQNPDLVATVLIGRFSPATGVMRIAGGGHPPALLVRAGGLVQELEAPGIAIGWPGAGSLSVTTVQLERSDTVILYTDGLVEATKDITVGLATLARAAADTAGYPAPQLARALVERALAGAERRDDSLAVVVRRRQAPTGADVHRLGPFEHRFSPHLAVVPLARHLLGDWLERQPIDQSEVDGLLLVASELCSNAVKASSGAPSSVVLRAWAEDDALAIEVEDDGPGLTLPRWDEGEIPEPEMEQGRGLFLVGALTDEVEVLRRDDHTVVRCRKRAVLGGVD